MPSMDHEGYANELLRSLADNHQETQPLAFDPNPRQSRNAAKAMTAILCHRLFRSSELRPLRKAGTTFQWKSGVFNSRNIADRDYLWTNIRRKIATELHEIATSSAVAYLLTCSSPSEERLSAWAIPEPLFYESLSTLPAKEGGGEYSIEIRPDRQRIEHSAESPDLSNYYRAFRLSSEEMNTLRDAREVDAEARRKRATERVDENGFRAITIFPDEAVPSELLIEGAKRTVIVNAYERNPDARRQCLMAHGTICCICGFDFGEVYGPLAEGYIHVHHVRPLSEIGASYVVDPVVDLRPVCPNCHAVIHMDGRCRLIDEVKELLEQRRGI